MSDDSDKPQLAACLPWHEPALRELLAQQDRLPHALLLTGPAGIGKGAFGQALAAALLCETPRNEEEPACGRCPACGWLAAGTHPDLRRLSRHVDDAGKVSADIRVEQFRALAEFLTVGAHRGARRVVLIDPADALNTVTANALLKTLEEPGDGMLILIAAAPDQLLSTIRSRCQLVPFGRLEPAELRQVLPDWDAGGDPPELAQLAAGSPGALLELRRQWQALPDGLSERLLALPGCGDPRQALELARDLTEALEGEQQQWLLCAASCGPMCSPGWHGKWPCWSWPG